MADDKKSRNKQADDAERRQRERELQEARDRDDEPEPTDPEQDDQLGELDDSLEAHEYPTTVDDLRGAYGDHAVETEDGSRPLEDVLEPVDDESYDSADDVRDRIQGLVHR
ncbi:DUF5789 family protein [Natronorubrum texcoconense]|uniref:DUF2795 domain-containing protein n=1 Tax=Natronorubrum texcoconense TaxID=1095776 RepID=A0A1G9H102_9EURY|nr:hypothetical protein [Natronorubrum texcoconense]SDL06559.1 hypothetical protein SAMN04515672_0095 [Natronorubrum texcoconense]